MSEKVTVKEIATGREFKLTPLGAENLVKIQRDKYEIMTKSAPKAEPVEEKKEETIEDSSVNNGEPEESTEEAPKKRRGRKPKTDK